MLDVIYDMGLRMQWCKWKLKWQIVSRSCRMNINFYRCWTMNINFYSQLVTYTFTTGRGTSTLPTTSPLSSSPYPPKLFILDTYGVSSAIPVNSGDNVSIPDFGGGPEHRSRLSSDDGIQFRTPNKGAVFLILVFTVLRMRGSRLGDSDLASFQSLWWNPLVSAVELSWMVILMIKKYRFISAASERVAITWFPKACFACSGWKSSCT